MPEAMFLGIYREKVFSPGKVREDAAILNATLSELSLAGYKTSAVEAENLKPISHNYTPSIVLTMAQSERPLNILEDWQKKGARIINSPSSIRNSYRRPLISLLKKANLPMPPSQVIPLEMVEQKVSFERSTSYWLKRGDVHAMQDGDVVKVTSKEELNHALNHFRRQEIKEILLQGHVDGEVIKFYGVGAGEYFKAFLASSGDEVTSQVGHLSLLAYHSAKAVGLEIYGGDAIITQKGEIVLIDLNDWPSFWRCSASAAKRIAEYVKDIYEGGVNGISNAS